MNREEFWCLAIVRGTCKRCGREVERQMKVNRSWKNHMLPDGRRAEEPVGFGYMGDCVCGKAMGGEVSWPFLAVFDEKEEP